MFDDSELPITPAALDASFLSRALSRDVDSVICRPLGLDVGFTGGQVVRLGLTYSSQHRREPATLIAKLSPATGEMRRRFSSLNRSEVEFYSGFAQRYGPGVPQCYFASFDPAADSSVLLLEDLGAPDATSFLRGGTWPQAASVIDALARGHAAFWQQPVRDALTAGGALRGFDLGSAFDAYPARLHDVLPGHTLPTRFLEICAALAEAPNMLERMTRAGPKTLVHRDPHLDNVAFRAAGKATLMDWQFAGWGCGAFDVSYFMISSFAPDTRRVLEASAMERYHAALEAAGVRDYAFDTCWQDYLCGVFAKICMTVIATVCFDTATPHKFVWRAADLQRLLTFCEDHAITPALLFESQRLGAHPI